MLLLISLIGALAFAAPAQGQGYQGSFGITPVPLFLQPSAFEVNISLPNGTPTSSWDGTSLTKWQLGSLILSVTNTYTGPTIIDNGILALASRLGSTNDDFILTSSGVLMARGARFDISYALNGARIQTLNDTDLRFVPADTINFPGPDYSGVGTRLNYNFHDDQRIVALGNSKLTILNGGFFSGVIQDAGFLKREDTGTAYIYYHQDSASGARMEINTGSGGTLAVAGGTLILTGTNTYTGGTEIDGGVLELGDGGTTGSIVGNVVDNERLVFNRSDEVIFDGQISGIGMVKHIGTGTTTVTGANSYSGGTHIIDGTMAVHQSSTSSLTNLGTGPVEIDSIGTLWARTTGAFSFANDLTGKGLLLADNADHAFSFTADAGDAFAGTVELRNNTFNLSGDNTAALTNAKLVIGTGNVTKVGTGPQTIGGLAFDGGTAAFLNVSLPTGAQESYIDVSGEGHVLNLGGTGKVQVTVSGVLPNPPVTAADNLLVQDDQGALIKLAGISDEATVTGTAGGLTLVDQNGALIDPAADQIVQIVQGGNAVHEAVYSYRLNTGTEDDGLYLAYALSEVKLIGTGADALLLTPDAGASGLATDLSAKVTGAGDIAADAGTNRTVSLSNATNSYTGTTFARSGTLLMADDNVLGRTSNLRVEDGATVDMNGFSQSVGAVNTQAGGKLRIAAGSVLTITDAQRAAGNPLGGGIGTNTLSGSGTLVIDPSILYVNGDQTGYTGPVTVTGGSALVLNSASAFNAASGIKLETAIDSLVFGSAAAYTPSWTAIPNGISSVAISGLGGVRIKNGSDVTFSSTANSYSGLTGIDAGTLRAGGVNRFSPNSSVRVSSAGVLDLAGFNQTVAGVINAGLVSFGADSTRTPGTKLTINGNYEGQTGGVIALNTVLGGDNSLTDKLVINGGHASGTTTLRITNVGGTGAQTVQGIQVVETTNGATTVANAFTLGSERVIAGSYEYLLQRTGENWYLTSEQENGDPILRPETPEYAPIAAMGRSLALATMRTLHERVGEEENLRGQAENRSLLNGLWGRVLGERQTNSFTGAGNPSVDGNLWASQLGLDLYRHTTAGGSRNHFGVAGSYSNFSSTSVRGDARDSVDIEVGELKLTGPSAAVFLTHFGPSGWYLDAVGQMSWFDVTATTLAGSGLKTKLDGVTASVEIGKPVRIGTNGMWLVEPQAQLIWQGFSIDRHAGDLGPPSLPSEVVETSSVDWNTADAWTGRLGLRIQQSCKWGEGPLWQRYGRINLWHGFAGADEISFNGENPIGMSFGGTAVEGGLGMTAKLGRLTSLYGEALYRHSVGGGGAREQTGVFGTFGLRLNW
ncbi:MAG: autotransporter outer membrane beta-barrel domain-containing protein [Gemmatimonadota bacterium]|jgi:outer membrane autotransporter protein|nr:autotransporter outer membrane beta-barrel domain-containing protein [Gemmatimonadota bacterium]